MAALVIPGRMSLGTLRAMPQFSSRIRLVRPQRRTLSGSGRLLAEGENKNQNQNPSLPAFDLKHVSTNPRMRKIIWAVLIGLGLMEGAAWLKIGPKIWGKEERAADSVDGK